jgi:hypothetical protein
MPRQPEGYSARRASTGLTFAARRAGRKLAAIHTAAFVDLMRNLVQRSGYQLLMSSHDRGEADFIYRKFDAAGLPCTVVELTVPSREGVVHLPVRYNDAAKNAMSDGFSPS